MREGLVKFVIVAITAFFSVSMAHGDTVYTEHTKVTWIDKDGVIIGFKLDEFSPTKDTLKVSHTKNNVKKEDPMISGRDVIECLVRSIWFYVFFIFVLWLGLFFIVVVLLTIISFCHKILNKR